METKINLHCIKIQFVAHRENNVLQIREEIVGCCSEDAQIYCVEEVQEF
jgi:hypothetical protein